MSFKMIEHAQQILSSPDACIYSEQSDAYRQNAGVIAFQLGTIHLRKAEVFFSPRFKDSKIALIPAENDAGIEFDHGKIILSAGEEEIGPLTDFFLDITESAFGAENSKAQANRWPGNYFLGWSGKRISAEILTKDFYDKFMQEAATDSESMEETRNFLNEGSDFWMRLHILAET